MVYVHSVVTGIISTFPDLYIQLNALYINQLKMTEVSVETCLVISNVLSFSLNF